MDNEKTIKFCDTCHKSKVVDEFSIKSGRNEKKIRRDKYCKLCRANNTKKKRKELDTLKNKNIPKRSIELQKKHRSKEPCLINTLSKSTEQLLDFGLWNNLYAKELDDSEKIEIQSNLMAFVTVTGKAWSKQTGDYIELSKN